MTVKRPVERLYNACYRGNKGTCPAGGCQLYKCVEVGECLRWLWGGDTLNSPRGNLFGLVYNYGETLKGEVEDTIQSPR